MVLPIPLTLVSRVRRTDELRRIRKGGIQRIDERTSDQYRHRRVVVEVVGEL
jgi:hypothetical protein